MLESMIKLIFPPRCVFCGCILNADSIHEICKHCYAKIPFLDGEVFAFREGFKLQAFYDDVVCVCEYSGIIKESLLRFKFFNKAGYYRALAGLLSNNIKKMTKKLNFDIISYIPLHKHREADRGYNQSQLIARYLSRELGIPLAAGLLARVRDTKSQSLLDRRDRHKNIRGCFTVDRPDRIKGKIILLVDDILTTGSTMDECSKVLKRAGAKSVTAAVIASGRLHHW